MIACRKSFFLILMILLPGFLFAQIPVSYATQDIHFRLHYQKDGAKVNLPGNAILREMAKDVLREPWHVNIQIVGKLILDVEKEGERQDLLISFDRPAVFGDTAYRKFPVAGVLLPSRISMKLKWANRADTTGFSEETLSWLPLPDTGALICRRPVSQYNPLVDTLMAREIDFFYDSLSLQKFNGRISLIHDYYASVALLDSLDSFAAVVHTDDANLLPYNYLKIEEVNRMIACIDTRNFREKLLHNGYDPAGLLRKRDDMFKYSRSLIYNFIDALHKVGAIPWDGDVSRLATFFTSRVASYVRRSLLMDQQQGLIYSDCLDHLFEKSDFPSDEHVLEKMVSKMYPGSRQDTIAPFISKAIYQSYRMDAMQLMEQKRFAEAFSLMENGRRFVSANPPMHGISRDLHLQSEAARGICDSYVGIASSCIVKHKYDMAANYLAKASQYTERHAEYGLPDSAYRAVFSELFFLRNTDCDQLLESKKYSEALDCYGQFEKSYSPRDLAMVSGRLAEKISAATFELSKQSEILSADALKHRNADTALFYYEQARILRQAARLTSRVEHKIDSLAPVMAKIKFEQIYRDGTQALDKRQFTLSVNRLKEAKALAEDYRIDRGREFDSIYRRAMKYLLIVQLSASQKKIWANEFDSAKFTVEKTEAAGFDYGLLNDPEFITATHQYKERIREQHCRNLQDSLDLRMIRADRAINLRKYIRSVGFLTEALDFVRSMPACNIPEGPILDTLAKYRFPAEYQQKLEAIRALVATGSYTNAVRDFIENLEFYKANHLERFGMPQEEIYIFAASGNNPYLTSTFLTHFMGAGNYKEAYRLMQLSYKQGLSAGTTDTVQEQIARIFAQKDYKESLERDPDLNVGKLVGTDNWFDPFRKAYLREWNSLVKAADK